MNRKFYRLPRTLANTLGITNIRASLFPEGKTTAVAEFQARHDYCKHRPRRLGGETVGASDCDRPCCASGHSDLVVDLGLTKHGAHSFPPDDRRKVSLISGATPPRWWKTHGMPSVRQRVAEVTA